MKPRILSTARLSIPLAIAIAALLGVSGVRAANYYWDSDGGATAGLGNTGSLTWGSSANEGTVPGGILNGTATTAATAPASGDTLFFGTVNLALGGTASTIGTTGTLTLTNIVFGAGQTNAVTLSSGGTITLAGSTPTIAVNNTSDTIAAVVAGTVGMTKGGAGELILTGTNSFSGGLTLSGGGKLSVGNGTLGSLTSNALTFNTGGGTLNVAQAASSSQNMGALTFSAGDGSVISSSATGSSTATLTFASLAARAAGATANFSLATNTTASENKILLTSTTNAPVNGSGSNNQGVFFGGSDYARYDTTAGYFRAVTYGTDSNASALIGTAATLGVNDATKDVRITGDITAQTTASVNTLNLGASNFTLQDTAQTLSVNGILSVGASAASITTVGKIQATGGGVELSIRVNGSSDGLSIAPIIQNNGASASALTKSGAGTLTLAAANTYTGTTTINAGTLVLSGGTAIVDTGAVVLANAPGATLLLDANETIGSLAGGGFSGGNVNVQGNTLTLANASGQTFGGVLSGAIGGGVTLSSGTLTLSNKNSFAGTITLSGTSQLTLSYGNDGSASPAPLSSGGTLSMAGGTTLYLAPTANVAAGVAGSGVQNILGGTLISNPINVSSGSATLKTDTQNDKKYVFNGGVTGGISGSQSFSIIPGFGGTGGDRDDLVFSGVMANGSGGTLGVNVDFQAGSSTGQDVYVALSGQNTFTGPISVTNTKGLIYSYTAPTGAFLVIGGEVIHQSFAARTVYPGTGYLGGGNYSNTISLATGTVLDYASSASQTLGGVISGGGNLVMEGSGTLTLSAANTFTGTTLIKAGILNLGNTSALQNSTLDMANSITGTTSVGLQITGTTLTLGGLSGTSSPKNLASIFTTPSGGYSNITALTLTIPTGVSDTYSGIIANGASGGMGLTKAGTGTQILSGANSYTGGTTLTTGTLQFGKLVAQPATGAVAVGTGSTLAVNLGGTGEWTTGTSGNGTIGGLLAGLGGQSGGTVTYAGNVVLGFDCTNTTTSQTYSAAIANIGSALGITKLGTGTLVLSAANIYTGGTTITGGTLQFAKTYAMPATGAVAVGTGATLAVNVGGTNEWTTGTSGSGTIGGLLAGIGGQGAAVTYAGAANLGFDTSNAGSTQTYSNAIANLGSTLGITKLGTGTFVLSGLNTYTGVTAVNGGTLLLDKTGTGNTAALATTSALTLGGGNFQLKGKTSGATTQTLGALTLTANTLGTITLDSNGGTGSTLTLANSAPTRGTGSTLLVDLSMTNTVLTSTLGLTAAAQTNTQAILGYALVKDTTGTGFATNVGGSIVRYTGADVLTSSAPTAGASVKTSPAATSTTGSPYLTTSASPTYNSLSIDTSGATGANFLALSGTVTLTQKALFKTGSNDFILQSGTLGASNSEVIVHQMGTGNLTIGSTISGGTGSLTKDGSGTLTLTNASNAYTGGTVIHAGTLVYASKSALGTGSITLAGGTKFLKITEEGNSAGVAMSNNITLNGQVEMNVDFGTAKDQWFSGVVSGAGSLKVTGGSGVGRTVSLAGANTFTGGVTLDTTTTPAWIQLGNATALGYGTLTINATGGNFDRGLGSTTALTSGSGVANNIVINSGATLNLGGPGATGNMLLSGAISGAGSLNKQDVAAVTVSLSGTNTYTGATTVISGTLALVGGSQASPITVATGASLGFTLGSPTSSSSSVNLASGTVKITGTPTLSSYTLMTASGGITGPVNLAAAITGYNLVIDGNALKLNATASYSTWSDGSAANLDPNNDGVTNGVAWVLGAAGPGTNALSLLPTSDDTTDSTHLLFVFRRAARVATDSNATIAVEYGSTLSGWRNTIDNSLADGVITTIDANGFGTGIDKVTVSIPKSIATGSKLFARLRVVVGP